MGTADTVQVVSSVSIGSIHFIQIQFATFIPTVSLRVQLQVDCLKGMKGNLLENKKRVQMFFIFRKTTSALKALNVK